MSSRTTPVSPPRFLRQRRRLLQAVAAGGTTQVLSACGGGGGVATASATNPTGTAGPTAAGALPASVGPAPAPISNTPTGSLAVTIVSATTQSSAPFCFGLPVRKGDVPAGQGILASVPGAQVIVRNRWPDGSAKFAIVSGSTAVVANTPLRLTFGAGTPSTAGSALTESDLRATGVAASLAFQSVGTVELGPLIGVASTYDAGIRRWTAGRVAQQIAGPEMSAWIYYAPIGADTSLTAWFEVRLWRSGAVEVLPWIENGWLRVPGATSRSGRVVFTLGGSTRYDSASAIDLPHHCRFVAAQGTTLSHWLGADPAVRFSHDVSYLQSTRLTPTYYVSGALSGTLASTLAQSYQPLGQANMPTGMGTAGYHASIGLLPEWDVAYLVSNGDTRALNSVIVNGYAAGRYPIHYRDETTNRPLRFSDCRTLVVSSAGGMSSSGASSANDFTPTPSGTAPPVWTTSHHPSVGYFAYLVTGRHFFCEEIQFSACAGFLKQSDSTRRGIDGVLETSAGANTTRGAAWSLRTLAQACTATPDDDAVLQPEFIRSVTRNIEHYHTRYVASPSNPLGVCQPYSDYTAGDGQYQHAMWMEDFLTAAWGYLAAMEPNVASDVNTKLRQFFEWKARSVDGRLGANAAGQYFYAEAVKYTLSVAPADNPDWVGGAGPWYTGWGDVFTVTPKDGPLSDPRLRGGYFPDATSYWGNFQPAVAYVVDLNASGALDAYRRMTGASNWAEFVASAAAAPVWAVRPRASLSA